MLKLESILQKVIKDNLNNNQYSFVVFDDSNQAEKILCDFSNKIAHKYGGEHKIGKIWYKSLKEFRFSDIIKTNNCEVQVMPTFSSNLIYIQPGTTNTKHVYPEHYAVIDPQTGNWVRIDA